MFKFESTYHVAEHQKGGFEEVDFGSRDFRPLDIDFFDGNPLFLGHKQHLQVKAPPLQVNVAEDLQPRNESTIEHKHIRSLHQPQQDEKR